MKASLQQRQKDALERALRKARKMDVEFDRLLRRRFNMIDRLKKLGITKGMFDLARMAEPLRDQIQIASKSRKRNIRRSARQ